MDAKLIGTLFDYHYWANRRMLDAVAGLNPEQFTRDLHSSFPSVQATLTHMLNAEAIWLSRMLNTTPAKVEPQELPDVAAVRERWALLEPQLLAMIAEDDLERVIVARNSSGKEFRSPLWQVLHQLSNHGTYHRGQITTMLRQLGATPANTDLITYYREKSGQL